MVSCFSASKTTQNKMTIGLMFRPCKAICFPLDPLCTKPCRILHHVGSYTYVGVVFFGFFFLRRNCVGLGMNFFFGLASDDDDDESGLGQGILKQTD